MCITDSLCCVPETDTTWYISCTPERGFPGGGVVKSLPANVGDTRDTDSIPGSGKSPREGNRNPLQRYCLENSMDRRSLV